VGYDNFRDGYMAKGTPLGATSTSVTLIADNTPLDMTGIGLLLLGSNNTTAANRTFTLGVSKLVGHMLTITFTTGASTTAQLVNTGIQKLQADWEPTQYDSIQLISDGTNWLEAGRGAGSIPAGSIVNADVSASAAIAFSKLATLTSTQVLVGSAGNVATSVAVTGDVTIGNTGVTAIGSAKVLLAMLGAGIAPSHVVKYAGKRTTAGGSASEAFTVTGVAATDIVFVTIQTVGVTPRTIVSAAPTTNTVTIVFSGDPSTDHIVSYQALRAAA